MDALVYPRTPIRLTERVTPLKPLEAMAYSRLVIASDVGGHREFIEDGLSGLLFKASDVSALANTITRLLGDNELRNVLRLQAEVHVENNHSWAKNIEKYLNIYTQLVA